MANHEVSVRIIGLDELIGRFDSSNPVVRREMKRAMMRAVLGEMERMPAYPPKSDSSTYRRTGLLGRSLTSLVGRAPDAGSAVEGEGDTIRGIVGTAVKYAPYVIGPAQAKAHQGNWWLLEETVQSHKREINAEFIEADERIVEYLAGKGEGS
jgi:hypothetical protein